MYTVKNVALLLTQYEQYGVIGTDEYLQYFIDEELELNEDNIADYNEYLAENGYETFFEDLDEALEGRTPSEIARMCFYGNFNYSYDLHRFNGYENIDSFESWQVVNEMKADTNFIKWYIEQNDLIDFNSDEVTEAIKEANELLKIGY